MINFNKYLYRVVKTGKILYSNYSNLNIDNNSR